MATTRFPTRKILARRCCRVPARSSRQRRGRSKHNRDVARVQPHHQLVDAVNRVGQCCSETDDTVTVARAFGSTDRDAPDHGTPPHGPIGSRRWTGRLPLRRPATTTNRRHAARHPHCSDAPAQEATTRRSSSTASGVSSRAADLPLEPATRPGGPMRPAAERCLHQIVDVFEDGVGRTQIDEFRAAAGTSSGSNSSARRTRASTVVPASSSPVSTCQHSSVTASSNVGTVGHRQRGRVVSELGVVTATGSRSTSPRRHRAQTVRPRRPSPTGSGNGIDTPRTIGRFRHMLTTGRRTLARSATSCSVSVFTGPPSGSLNSKTC